MFKNRIRLPLTTRTPQFPTEANRFRKANGETKTLSVVIRHTYEILTDYLSESLHQKLVIALNHDIVNIESDKYLGGIAMDGDYSIEWPEFMDYPFGQAKVLVQVTPFDVTNSNCQSCDVLSQLSLVDDDIGPIAQGDTATVEAYVNDSICCFPITAEIVSFASGYLDAATIDQATGIISLTAKDPASPVGSIVLATYRVTCPDGTFDEADVYGSITGSGTECEQPSGFDPVAITPGPPLEVTVSWSDPAITPPGGFEWVLYRSDTPGVPVFSGTTTDHFVDLTGLENSTDYGFYVRSVCSDGVFSAYTEQLFTTPAAAPGSDCGTFDVTADDGTTGNDLYSYSFMQCDGNLRTRYLQNLVTRVECMLVDAFNVPVYFNTTDPVTYNYTGTC